jgi:hypothetical protein
MDRDLFIEITNIIIIFFFFFVRQNVHRPGILIDWIHERLTLLLLLLLPGLLLRESLRLSLSLRLRLSLVLRERLSLSLLLRERLSLSLLLRMGLGLRMRLSLLLLSLSLSLLLHHCLLQSLQLGWIKLINALKEVTCSCWLERSIGVGASRPRRVRRSNRSSICCATALGGTSSTASIIELEVVLDHGGSSNSTSSRTSTRREVNCNRNVNCERHCNLCHWSLLTFLRRVAVFQFSHHFSVQMN